MLRAFLVSPRQPLFRTRFAPLPPPAASRAPAPPRSAAAETRAPASLRVHRVRYLASGVELSVSEEQSLLQAGLDAGLSLRSACRRGLCGTCKSKLVSGEVEMRQPNVLSDEERARGYCLPCISRPRGEVTLDA